MMNSINIHQENPTGGPKIFNSRRPLQRLSVNKSSSKSPCGGKKSAKPKASIVLKPRMEPQDQQSLPSENASQWLSIKSTRTPSLDSEVEEIPSIFRARSVISDDNEDMFVLKRANPVYDSDDEDYLSAFASPTKRRRTTNQNLEWDDKLSENTQLSVHF